MKYTLLTFHFDRGELKIPNRLPGLQILLDELERDAAVLAQGIYILRPDLHSEVIERIRLVLQTLQIPYAVVSFQNDSEAVHHYQPMHLSCSEKARLKLAVWEKDAVAGIVP